MGRWLQHLEYSHCSSFCCTQEESTLSISVTFKEPSDTAKAVHPRAEKLVALEISGLPQSGSRTVSGPHFSH